MNTVTPRVFPGRRQDRRRRQAPHTEDGRHLFLAAMGKRRNRLAGCILMGGIAFFLCHPAIAANADTLAPDQAAAAVGERRTVCGKVANTYYSCFVSGRPTFINFGRPYPNHVFSLAIMGEDRGNFGDCPEKLFAGRDVCVSGLIESYDGKPLMKVKDQSQVRWND